MERERTLPLPHSLSARSPPPLPPARQTHALPPPLPPARQTHALPPPLPPARQTHARPSIMSALQLAPSELIDRCIGSRIWILMKGNAVRAMPGRKERESARARGLPLARRAKCPPPGW